MKNQLYYFVGDLVTTTTTGALTGAVCALVVQNGWNSLAAMALGMLLSMILAFILNALLGILFGALEVMILTMTTGMVVGMIVSMQVAGEISFYSAVQLGAELGLGVMAFAYLTNSLLRGEVRQ